MFPGEFDGDFITSTIGYTKEQPEYWKYILHTLDRFKPEDIYFFDDTQSCVDAAKQAGINSHLYTSVKQLNSILEL